MLKLVINNTKKKQFEPLEAMLKGTELHRELEKIPTVQGREQLIIENLKRMGF